MARLGYPPHVTLAIYDDEAVREAEVRDALDRASKNLRAVTLTFDGIYSFDGPPMVLWASPRPSAVLRNIHEAIHAAINPHLLSGPLSPRGVDTPLHAGYAGDG